MNSVQLVGRLTRDPDVRYTNGGLTIAKFSVAIDRKFKTEGEETADFINCSAFGKTAEFMEKFFHKGMRVGLTGRIQTGSYTNKDGVKVYTTEVVAESVEFTESKNANAQSSDTAKPSKDFMDVPDALEDELPFN